MKFHLDDPPFEPGFKLKHTDQLFFIGSCFSDTMSVYFENRKFKLNKNPFGVLYNPVSIADAIEHIVTEKKYPIDAFIKHNDLFASWHHHSNFSETKAEALKQKLEAINVSNNKALKNTDIIFITLGTAWAQRLKNSNIIVANNHKISPKNFEQIILATSTIVQQLQRIISLLKSFKPDVKIIFTLSPVRHSRQGLVANNVSKAYLLSAIQEVLDKENQIVYLPTYELVIDVLRDYRYYQKDLVHPNELTTDYIWVYLLNTLINPNDKQLLDELYQIGLATRHKIRHSHTKASVLFINQQISKIKELSAKYTYLDFSTELAYYANL